MVALKIIWGDDPEPPFDQPTEYTFRTEAEVKSFIWGANESLGYQDFKVIKNAPIH